jgi:hypothetical protein
MVSQNPPPLMGWGNLPITKKLSCFSWVVLYYTKYRVLVIFKKKPVIIMKFEQNSSQEINFLNF